MPDQSDRAKTFDRLNFQPEVEGFIRDAVGFIRGADMPKDYRNGMERLEDQLTASNPKRSGSTISLDDIKRRDHALDAGMVGPLVAQTQEALNRAGATIDIEPDRTKAVYGAATEEAMKDFQKKHGLDDSGELDKETAAVLDVQVPTPVPTATPIPARGKGKKR